MPGRKQKAESTPTSIQPNMMADIENILKAQGIEMDAEALAFLNQSAGDEFEKTYKEIARKKAQEAKTAGDETAAKQIEADVEDESMEGDKSAELEEANEKSASK